MSDITNRLRELAHAVADQRWSEFSMRVPADRGRDADLVLMRAADEITQLRAENARLIAAAPELAEALKLWARWNDMTEAEGLIQRLRAEPTASQFLSIGDLVESLVAERNEAADRIASLEAEKAERERQEPVAWAWDDALGCMHAHCGPVWVDGECSDATRAETSLRPLYAAPPIPRVEQETALSLVADVRAAIGDDGKRMQPELVEYCGAMKRDAERYRWLRNESWSLTHCGRKYPRVAQTVVITDPYMRATLLAEEALDAAVDAAMGGGNG